MMDFTANRSADPGRIADPQEGPLSEGEVGFLWWFIQGGIMDQTVRERLHHGWGLCARHSLAFLSVNAAFFHHYLHGPAVLYADLMKRAGDAFALAGPLHDMRLLHRLRASGPCHLCEQGLGAASAGFASPQHLVTGRDISQIRAFMAETRPFWTATVCGRCAGTSGEPRCRVHLLEDLSRGTLHELEPQRHLVEHITQHMLRYERSFRWEFNGTDTLEDRSALISAVGWCSGWDALLHFTSTD